MIFAYLIVAMICVPLIVVSLLASYSAFRALWRRHCELRSIARAARIARLYGFRAPLDDERNWLERFRKELRS